MGDRQRLGTLAGVFSCVPPLEALEEPDAVVVMCESRLVAYVIGGGQAGPAQIAARDARSTH